MINVTDLFEDTIEYKKSVEMFRDDFVSNEGIYVPKNVDKQRALRSSIELLDIVAKNLKTCIAIVEDARDNLLDEYR